MKTYPVLLILSIGFFLWNCTKEAVVPAPSSELSAEQVIEQVDLVVDSAEQALQKNEVRSGKTVYVPAASVDALADALAEAGKNGKVVLESGLHHETGTVMITERVKLEGEPGAILTVDVAPQQAGPPFQLDPALHVTGADHVHISNLEIKPAGATGRTGILVENGPHVRISGNIIQHFQFAVFLSGADHALVYDNYLKGIDNNFSVVSWGVTAMDGKSVVLKNNEITTYVAAIYTSDQNGVAFKNTLYGNVMGFLICTVAPIVSLPDGTVVQAPSPSNQWVITTNTAFENNWGYLVIDGAFENLVVQNEAFDNFTDQIELAGVTDRFGATMPTSHDNLVISVGPYADIPIKDCGEENTIIGGVLKDTQANPCY